MSEWRGSRSDSVIMGVALIVVGLLAGVTGILVAGTLGLRLFFGALGLLVAVFGIATLLPSSVPYVRIVNGQLEVRSGLHRNIVSLNSITAIHYTDNFPMLEIAGRVTSLEIDPSCFRNQSEKEHFITELGLKTARNSKDANQAL